MAAVQSKINDENRSKLIFNNRINYYFDLNEVNNLKQDFYLILLSSFFHSLSDGHKQNFEQKKSYFKKI
jgi:hypothetical protein